MSDDDLPQPPSWTRWTFRVTWVLAAGVGIGALLFVIGGEPWFAVIVAMDAAFFALQPFMWTAAYRLGYVHGEDAAHEKLTRMWRADS